MSGVPGGTVVARGPQVLSDSCQRCEWLVTATPKYVRLWIPDMEYNTLYAEARRWQYRDESVAWWRWRLKRRPTFFEACEAALRYGHNLREAQARLADQIEVARILETL